MSLTIAILIHSSRSLNGKSAATRSDSLRSHVCSFLFFFYRPAVIAMFASIARACSGVVGRSLT